MSADEDETELAREPVRVVLANDDPIVIEGLRSMLAPYADRVHVVSVAIGDSALVGAGIDEEVPDIMLLDAFSRGAAGIDAAAMVLSTDPKFRVVIFTSEENEAFLLQALRLGVAGYLLKSTSPENLIEDIERIARGETVVDRRLATKAAIIAANANHVGSWKGAHLGLTKREGEVLRLVGEGCSTAAIAEQLHVGSETVKSHLRRIYPKIGVTDRAAAVAVAWREGLVTR